MIESEVVGVIDSRALFNGGAEASATVSTPWLLAVACSTMIIQACNPATG